MAQNNPAGRLLALINEGKKPEYSNKPYLEAWKDILKLKDRSLSNTLYKLSYILLLPQQIEKTLLATGIVDNIDRYVSKIRKIPSFMQVNLNGSWSNFIKNFDDVLMKELEICNDILSAHKPEKTISDNDLNKLKEKVQELLTEIENAELDEAFKKEMLNMIYRIINSIELYQIVGVKALEEVFEHNIGTLSVKKDFFKKYKEIAQNSIQKFFNIMQTISTLYSIADTFHRIPDTIKSLLP